MGGMSGVCPGRRAVSEKSSGHISLDLIRHGPVVWKQWNCDFWWGRGPSTAALGPTWDGQLHWKRGTSCVAGRKDE